MTIKTIETLRNFTWTIPEDEKLRLSIGTIMDVLNNTNVYGHKMSLKNAIFTVSEYRKSLKPGCEVDKAIEEALETLKKRGPKPQKGRDGERK